MLNMLWWISGLISVRKFNNWISSGYKRIKVLGLITFSVDFGSQRIECLRNRNILEVTDFSRFRTPKKLEFDWLTKRMGSDSFTICGKRI